ncbi:hypothetical protein C2R60_06115 [Helicobacter pylori]|uniref:hypothetical protein n=1 Tax=Helicobacter pylori TaxID=210 RepID=UPI000D3722BA|nr:hypothetical protein C2R60_06115 [Helicobacter pylori]
MNAQELIKKSALIEKVLKEQGLQEKAKPFMSDNAVIKTEELEKTLKEMQAEDRDLKVGIIGRVKAGKSSLLNALIFEGVSDDLIDEVAFKRSVMAVLDRIEFKEFDYTDKLPGEIRGKTGNLKGDEANAFIQSVGNYVRDFEAETKKDVKGYIQGLREALERQNFASDTLKKLQKDMQNLHNQVQNKEQSIAQLDAKIKALKGI